MSSSGLNMHLGFLNCLLYLLGVDAVLYFFPCDFDSPFVNVFQNH